MFSFFWEVQRKNNNNNQWLRVCWKLIIIYYIYKCSCSWSSTYLLPKRLLCFWFWCIHIKFIYTSINILYILRCVHYHWNKKAIQVLITALLHFLLCFSYLLFHLCSTLDNCKMYIQFIITFQSQLLPKLFR